MISMLSAAETSRELPPRLVHASVHAQPLSETTTDFIQVTPIAMPMA
jgi:hypothetical protein